TGFLPPGFLGHDAGRRREGIGREEARRMLQEAGLGDTLQLHAALHPRFRDRCAPLFEALRAVWADLGVTVSIATKDMASFLHTFEHNDGLDLWIGRWIADYNDPDALTHMLFHSETGVFRNYYSSPEADRILDRARTESEAPAREALYRRFESLLLDSGIVIPLFQDVDFRVAGPEVRGLRLSSVPPHLNYSTLGKRVADTSRAPLL